MSLQHGCCQPLSYYHEHSPYVVYVPGWAHWGGDLLGYQQIVSNRSVGLSSSPLVTVYPSDSVEIILSCFSTRVTNTIVSGDYFEPLAFLLELLVVWEVWPMCLTPMVCKWCSAISEVDGLHFQAQFQLGDYFNILSECTFPGVGPL